MSKRFTDTEKWSHAWFRKLAPKHKCAWSYLLDKCDHAGIWIEDFEAMSFNIGEEINEKEFQAIFKDKVKKITSDKFLVEAFIEFQYGNLNPSNKVHKSVIDKISKIQGATEGLVCPLQGAKDKDKEKDKEEAKDKEKEEDKEKAREVLKSWNDEKIIVHEETDKLINSIVERMEKNGKPHDHVIEAITNYSKILKHPQSFFKYRWSLDEFLQRASAIKFYPGNFFLESYLPKKTSSKKSVTEHAQEQINSNPFREKTA